MSGGGGDWGTAKITCEDHKNGQNSWTQLSRARGFEVCSEVQGAGGDHPVQVGSEAGARSGKWRLLEQLKISKRCVGVRSEE